MTFDPLGHTFSLAPLSFLDGILKGACGPALIRRWKFLGLPCPLSLYYSPYLSTKRHRHCPNSGRDTIKICQALTLKNNNNKKKSSTSKGMLMDFASHLGTNHKPQKGGYALQAGRSGPSYPGVSRRTHWRRWRDVYGARREQWEQTSQDTEGSGQRRNRFVHLAQWRSVDVEILQDTSCRRWAWSIWLEA